MSVPKLHGSQAQTESIEQARERIRESIATYLILPGDRYEGELVDEVVA